MSPYTPEEAERLIKALTEARDEALAQLALFRVTYCVGPVRHRGYCDVAQRRHKDAAPFKCICGAKRARMLQPPRALAAFKKQLRVEVLREVEQLANRTQENMERHYGVAEGVGAAAVAGKVCALIKALEESA